MPCPERAVCRENTCGKKVCTGRYGGGGRVGGRRVVADRLELPCSLLVCPRLQGERTAMVCGVKETQRSPLMCKKKKVEGQVGSGEGWGRGGKRHGMLWGRQVVAVGRARGGGRVVEGTGRWEGEEPWVGVGMHVCRGRRLARQKGRWKTERCVCKEREVQ